MLSACQSREVVNYQYISLAMSPNIDLFLDEENHVSHYALLNDEAEIMLADINLLGLSYEEALSVIIDSAIETGYIDLLAEENGIALFAESTYNTVFQENIRDFIEDYLEDLKVGCVVIDQQAVGLASVKSVEGLQLTRFQAKMYDLFQKFNLDEDFSKLEIGEVITLIQSTFDTHLSEYQQLRETERLVLKNQYIQDLALFIDYYRQGVSLGLIEQLDLAPMLALFLNQYQMQMNKVDQRNQERTTYLQNKEENDLSEVIVGYFEASVMISNFPYTLNYYRIQFFDSGTYAESWSITADSQTQTSDYIGSYQVVDGQLTMNYPGTPLFQLFISNGRICGYDQDGNLLVFHEMNPILD